MRINRFDVLSCLLAALFSLLPLAARADSTNVLPVIEAGTGAFDVAKAPWLSDDTKKLLQGWIAPVTEGKFRGYVLAASSNGNFGFRYLSTTNPEVSIDDMVRQTLEQCEYFYFVPCRLLAISGQSLLRADGGYATQPVLLSSAPARFDAARIPFITEPERNLSRDYKHSPGPKAYAINDAGFWGWKTGATQAEAITAALDACKNGNAAVVCSIYALDDFVIMELQNR